MEKFVFTNANGEKITFDYKGDYLISRYSGLTNAEVEPITAKGFRQQGYTLETLSMGMRVIDLNIHMKAKTMESVYEHRRYMSKVLNPILGQGVLTYTNDYLSKSITCYCSGLPAMIERYGLLIDYNIQFTAVNPLWYDTAETAILLNGWDGGFTFPFKWKNKNDIQFAHKGNKMIISVTGDVASPIRAEFRCANVAIERPRLDNLTTGEFIQVLTNVGIGETMTVNTEYGNKSVMLTTADGKTSSAYHKIDINSSFFQLQRGDNILKFDTERGECDTYLYFRNYYTGV